MARIFFFWLHAKPIFLHNRSDANLWEMRKDGAFILLLVAFQPHEVGGQDTRHQRKPFPKGGHSHRKRVSGQHHTHVHGTFPHHRYLTKAFGNVSQLTAGIFTGPSRKATSEGIEEDMAVSFLSRLAIVRRLAEWKTQGKSAAEQNVWVMGFPGDVLLRFLFCGFSEELSNSFIGFFAGYLDTFVCACACM
jgi:hypothetical protein